MQFGKILQLLMAENNVTLRQLSDDLHISQSMLNNFIRCIWEPNFNTLKHMAAYFHVSTDYLIGYEGES